MVRTVSRRGDLERISQLAVDLGATDAKPVKASDIIVRDWVRLKCQYGCGGYGKRLTCPPYSPTPEQFRKILKGYSWAILLKFKPEDLDRANVKLHDVIAKLERETFLAGYYSSFGLACGPCPYCERCNLEACAYPELARPSMEACGIDVYASARKAGFKIEVVKSREEEPTYYGLLLLK